MTDDRVRFTLRLTPAVYMGALEAKAAFNVEARKVGKKTISLNEWIDRALLAAVAGIEEADDAGEGETEAQE